MSHNYFLNIYFVKLFEFQVNIVINKNIIFLGKFLLVVENCNKIYEKLQFFS